MYDLKVEDEVRSILTAWCDGQAERQAATLHSDFMAVGREDGLHVIADRRTFLAFAKRMPAPFGCQAKIEWVDTRGPVAAACITHVAPKVRRTTVLTLMRSARDWAVVTATFHADDLSGITGARSGLLQ